MTKPIIRVGFVTIFSALLSPTPALSVAFDAPQLVLDDPATQAVTAATFAVGTLSILAVLVAIAVSLRQWVWVSYTTLVLMGLIYIVLFEQNVTGINWSGVAVTSPQLIVLGYAMLSINYLVAAQTIPTDHKWARLKLPYRLAAFGVWAVWLLARDAQTEVAYVLFSLTACTVAVAHFVPVSTFSRLRGGYDSIIRNLIWVLLTFVLIGGSVLIAGGFEAEAMTIAINRFLILAITLGFGALFLRNIFILRSDREIAVQEALERAEEKARISEALLDAQEGYRAAVEVARNRNLRLATASHDIRQPLSSLRTSFAAFAGDMSAEARAHMQHSLDYLDELASSYITEAAADAGQLAKKERIEIEASETVEAEQVVETLKRMFGQDASDKGLSLITDVAPAKLQTQPLALMRVLCNALSNAISHGTPGELGVTGTQTKNSYEFRVCNPGATDLVHDAWNKGKRSDGSGLGLAIMQEQAMRGGLEVLTPDLGPETTCIAIRVPAPENGASV